MPKMKLQVVALLMSFGALLNGCQSPAQAPEPAPEQLVETQCQDPRPEVCTFQYQPVCALVDTGTRCVTTPCPASEWKTMSNACTACSNLDVMAYREGACDDSSPEKF